MQTELTPIQKNYFLEIGHPKTDLKQLELALKLTSYTLDDDKVKDKPISKDEAINILGENTFLSGISRSAFHYSSVRKNDKTNQLVYFSSHIMFE